MGDKKITKVINPRVAELDKKIPTNLLIKYGENHYILKAGLEWKANSLFGGAGYSLRLIPHTIDVEGQRYVFKAILTVLQNKAKYINYGEATLQNSNKTMAGQLLHLAATRAECRVLRMATACGYAAYDEVMTTSNSVEKSKLKDGNKPAKASQIVTIKSLGGKAKKGITFQEAADLIGELGNKKGKKK